MAHHVTETIGHFIGYLHLEELLNKRPIHFSGDYLSREKTDFDFGVKLRPSDSPAPFPQPSAPAALPRIQELLPSPSQTKPAGLSPTKEFGTVKPLPRLEIDEVVPSAAIGGGGGGPVLLGAPAIPIVNAVYTIGGSQYSFLEITQGNNLFDADVLLGDPAIIAAAGVGVSAGHSIDVPQLLAELIDQARGLIPAGAEVPGNLFGNITTDEQNAGTAPVALEASGGTGEFTRVETNQSFVDGEATTVPDDIVAAQIARINETVVRVSTPYDSDKLASEEATPTQVHVVTDGTPTGGIAQIATVGGNDSVNAAVLFDLADASASIIIEGNLHETNAITQINMLHDADAIEVSAAAFVEQAASKNIASNVTSFVDQPGTVYGNVSLGGVPGALNWSIDFVQGDFYDVTSLIQSNVIFDNDAIEQTTFDTHFTATLGVNGQLDVTQLLEFGKDYDLIVVGGDYFKVNSIVQINIVIDDDIIHQLSDGSGAVSQSFNANGNSLLNDAGIVNTGGANYKPLAGAPADLAEALGNLDTEFPYTFAIGLPGNGTDTLDVLYVTGNYYNYNLLVQTNVITDVDQVVQIAIPPPGSGDGAAEPGTVAQQASAGGNLATNLALIVNVDSTSDYQYLGGAHYEDTLLVQANIVTDEDTVLSGQTLHPDVVATIAALSGASEDGGADVGHSLPQGGGGSQHTDVMGGMLH